MAHRSVAIKAIIATAVLLVGVVTAEAKQKVRVTGTTGALANCGAPV